MKRILVIADDLTGAAEIAGIGFRHGLKTQLIRRSSPAVSHDLTVLDTDTRAASSAQASKAIVDALSQMNPDSYDLIYKKTDSVLRGPVLAELSAVLKAAKKDCCVLVPQNPSRGRVIRDGSYSIGGTPLHQTPFASDPDHPRTAHEVISLLDPQKTGTVHRLTLDSSITGRGILIADGFEPDHLISIARRFQPRMLPAGGADFFTAILTEVYGKKASSTSPTFRPFRSLFLCGSASAATKQFVAACEPIRPCVAMPDAVFQDANPDQCVDQWAQNVLNSLARSRSVVAYIPQSVDRAPGLAARLERAMAKLAEIVLSSTQLSHLFAEGGATASAVCRQMGWNELSLQSELASGVVALQPSSPGAPVLVIKPGSYRWPELVQTAV